MNHHTTHGNFGPWAGACPPHDPVPASEGHGTETRVTATDGHAFAVRRTGSGAPIVLLHDMAGTQRVFDPVRDALSWSNTVCTWDARGHGTARGTPECAVPVLGLLAADLDAALAAVAPQGAVLVGHGMGALTILEYLRHYGTARVPGVVLVDQSPRMQSGPDWPLGLFGSFDERDATALETRLRADFVRTWTEFEALSGHGPAASGGVVRPPAALPRRELRELATGAMLALWRSVVGRDYRVDLATLTVPLLAVLGGDSPYYDAAALARWLLASVPDAHVIRYPKCGHAPHATAPARFVRDVAAFAARHEPAAPESAPHALPVAAGRRGGALARLSA